MIKNQEKIMKLFEKADKYTDWFVFERIERKIMRKGIKKLSKKYGVSHLFLQNYLNIQNQVMDTVETKKTQKDTKDMENYFSHALLAGRIFELNLEFVQTMQKEFVHSANALTREMIEIYHISALLNYDKSYCKTFLGKDERDFPSFKTIRQRLKDGNYMPNVKEVTKEQFFDSFEIEYCIYSGLLHPKTDSFIHNLWVCDNDENGNWKNTRPYSKNKVDQNTTIFLFPKKTPFHPDYLKRMMHTFYTYTGFALDELNKLDKGHS